LSATSLNGNLFALEIVLKSLFPAIKILVMKTAVFVSLHFVKFFDEFFTILLTARYKL